jgi:hypothetical protein
MRLTPLGLSLGLSLPINITSIPKRMHQTQKPSYRNPNQDEQTPSHH